MNKTRLENIFLELVVALLSDNKEFIGLVKELYDEILNYKNIEDELGIDLVTLFKALLEDGIFFNDGHGKIIHVKAKDLWLRTDTKTYNIDFCRPLYTSNLSVDCNLKDYGKTWALTKGELE